MNLKNNILLFLKGMAMGAADLVPGVSGGTIAFITGIYNELLSTISNIKPQLFNTLLKKGFKPFWKELNGNFLLILLSGIAFSVLSLSKLISYLLQYNPIAVWAFFFGLILASIIYIGKQIKNWNIIAIFGLLIGTVFVVWISSIPPLSTNTSILFLVMAGFFASTAMILPGISGSFILLILGAYSLVINALSGIDTNPTASLKILIPIGVGILLGLITTSNVLSYLLKKYFNFMMALLTGFLLGSLYKVWPWKSTEKIFNPETKKVEEFSEITQNNYHSLSAYAQTLNKKTELKTVAESNITPQCYELINTQTPSELLFACIFAVIGFSVIFIIEQLSQQKNV